MVFAYCKSHIVCAIMTKNNNFSHNGGRKHEKKQTNDGVFRYREYVCRMLCVAVYAGSSETQIKHKKYDT